MDRLNLNVTAKCRFCKGVDLKMYIRKPKSLFIKAGDLSEIIIVTCTNCLTCVTVESESIHVVTSVRVKVRNYWISNMVETISVIATAMWCSISIHFGMTMV